MGADVTLENVIDNGGEPTADIVVKTSKLKGTVIGGEVIPTLIDEIPVIALLAAFAEGETVIEDSECVDVSYPTFYEQLNSLQ